jgi:hypothetical protein
VTVGAVLVLARLLRLGFVASFTSDPLLTGFEFTALKMLGEAEAKLREEGVTLWLAALSPESLGLAQGSPLGVRLGRERTFFTVPQAVERCLDRRAGA